MVGDFGRVRCDVDDGVISIGVGEAEEEEVQ